MWHGAPKNGFREADSWWWAGRGGVDLLLATFGLQHCRALPAAMTSHSDGSQAVQDTGAEDWRSNCSHAVFAV
jgi:hypothetical protein